MKAILISGVIILAIFLVVLSFIPLGIEPLTEVYFNNSSSLPVYIFPNQQYNYSFTIHNLEYQRVRYYYTIDAYNENNTLLYNLGKGETTLDNNESQTFYENFTMKGDFNRTEIVVNVTKDLSLETPKFKKELWWQDPNYPMSIDIHFWVEEIQGTKIVITP